MKGQGRTSGYWQRRLLLLILCSWGCVALPTLAQAHKLRVFAWVAGDIVTVESRFSGDRTLVQGAVVVQEAATGALLLQGETDANGLFSFSLAALGQKKETALRIIVKGGEGHQNEWLLQPEDMMAAPSDPRHDRPSPETVAITTVTSAATDETTSSQTVASNDDIVRRLDQLLEAKLAPIRRSLARAEEQKIKFTDILGGIGYLFGLAGIIAWMKSKEKK